MEATFEKGFTATPLSVNPSGVWPRAAPRPCVGSSGGSFRSYWHPRAHPDRDRKRVHDADADHPSHGWRDRTSRNGGSDRHRRADGHAGADAHACAKPHARTYPATRGGPSRDRPPARDHRVAVEPGGSGLAGHSNHAADWRDRQPSVDDDHRQPAPHNLATASAVCDPRYYRRADRRYADRAAPHSHRPRVPAAGV